MFFQNLILEQRPCVIFFHKPPLADIQIRPLNRGILADVIVFAYLHSALPTEGKVLDIN